MYVIKRREFPLILLFFVSLKICENLEITYFQNLLEGRIQECWAELKKRFSASLVRVGDVQGVSRRHAVRGKKTHHMVGFWGGRKKWKNSLSRNTANFFSM